MGIVIYICLQIREAAKKVVLLMAGPLRPNPPFTPSTLMAVGNLELLQKKL